MLKATICLLALVCTVHSLPRSEHHKNLKTLTVENARSILETMTKDELVKFMLETVDTSTLSRLVPNKSEPKKSVDDTYWWYFANSDCGYDDVSGTCAGQSVDGCKETCLKTQGCGGFNYPHGILKKTDCLSHKSASTVDLYVVEDKPQPPPPSNFPPIWPMPAKFSNGTTQVFVNALKFNFSARTSSADLQAAFERYQPIFFPHKTPVAPSGNAIIGVQVTVHDVNADLQLETDESYVLDIPANGGEASIQAETVFGAYHALETLSQLIFFDFETKQYSIAGAPWNIIDQPRFQHREVLVDSSRHFEPVPTIKALIDSLTYAKINVIHWHIVDEQSFPFVGQTHPELGINGSYSVYERYTIEDVQDVVEYARQRGVRIMVEIDTPGHAGSWCKSHPEICPSTTCLMPLNPATNATFDVIDGLFNDLTGGARGKGLFPDNMMHLGGDEVNTDCWKNTPAVANWLQQNNLTLDGGYEYFVKRVQAIAHKYQRDVVGWEEIWNHFGTSLDKSTIIHQWLPGSTIAKNATAHGYRVLWSTDGVWYLDGLKTTWETMYQQEPCNGIPDDACEKYVLGGGGEMWGETVDTSDIQQTIWPRLAAVAERLWSPRNVNDTAAAQPRFVNFRCLLNRRAVAAAPSFNDQARESPPGPGSCYAQ